MTKWTGADSEWQIDVEHSSWRFTNVVSLVVSTSANHAHDRLPLSLFSALHHGVIPKTRAFTSGARDLAWICSGVDVHASQTEVVGGPNVKLDPRKIPHP